MDESEVSDFEFDSDKSIDLYGDDPVFETREELDSFMKSCKVEHFKNKEFEDNICFEQQEKVVKDCTCGLCEDIWSEDFEHICCQQVSKYVLINIVIKLISLTLKIYVCKYIGNYSAKHFLYY